MIAASVVDWGALLDVIVISLAAGVGVTSIFAVAVLGASRSTDPHRERTAATRLMYGAMAVIGTLAALAAVVYGIYLMTDKG